MATIITNISDTDLISDGNEVINANFSSLNTNKIETSVIDTDSSLTANSDSKIPTQKAVKAYVDAGGNPNTAAALTGESGTTPSATNKFLDAQILVGIISPYAGSTAPTGYLLCDGTAVSRTTYSRLFSITSTTYGVGDGSSTFNLPDLRGKVPVGKSTDTEFDTLGETGGEKTHTLTIPEMPAHTHSIQVPGGTGGGAYTSASYSNGTTGSTGGGLAHNNLQPYITINYIIKY